MSHDAAVATKASSSSTVSLIGRPDGNAVQKIASAIQALDAPANGVVFEPFRLKCMRGVFNNIWNSERGDTPITFFQYNGGGGEFRALGDFALLESLDPEVQQVAPGRQILFAADSHNPVALAHPTKFEWILNDAGSGNPRKIQYFKIHPPKGYTALGIAFSNTADPDDPNYPKVENYWCVKTELVRSVGSMLFWSDKDAGWGHHNGNLLVPMANLPVPEPYMLFAPPTFLSVESDDTPCALVMKQADLNVSLEPGTPTFDKTLTVGDETTYGVTSVKILPYTAVPDPGFLNQSSESPFYFIAAEPYYECTNVLSTAAGGEYQIVKTIGTATEDTIQFMQETSMTVSADVGVEYGPISTNVSASYTQSFGTVVVQTTNHETQFQKQISLPLPEQPQTWIWELQTQVGVFRSDCTQLAPVTYSEPGILYVPGGVDNAG